MKWGGGCSDEKMRLAGSKRNTLLDGSRRHLHGGVVGNTHSGLIVVSGSGRLTAFVFFSPKVHGVPCHVVSCDADHSTSNVVVLAITLGTILRQ